MAWKGCQTRTGSLVRISTVSSSALRSRNWRFPRCRQTDLWQRQTVMIYSRQRRMYTSVTCSTWLILFCFFGLLQPMVFGAMIHRDEAFDAIYAQYLQINATATTITPETWWLNVDKTAASAGTMELSHRIQQGHLQIRAAINQSHLFLGTLFEGFLQTLVNIYKMHLKSGLFFTVSSYCCSAGM